jgi:hypothetical protein
VIDGILEHMKQVHWNTIRLAWLLAWLNVHNHAPPLIKTDRSIATSAQPPTPIMAKAQESLQLNRLKDGNYQFCSQPDPGGWQVGAGVCFVFSKRGEVVDGYYGYPHSNTFVCIRGKASDRQLLGEGFMPFWQDGAPEAQTAPESLKDQEGRLHLSQGKRVSSQSPGMAGTQILFFAKASLNVNQFYRYSAPRMTPVARLCDWHKL